MAGFQEDGKGEGHALVGGVGWGNCFAEVCGIRVKGFG